MQKKDDSVRGYILCALFAALITIGAQIRIPVPVVPFTLQFLFTTLAGLTLGSRRGAMAVAVYVAAGLAGLPVFSSGGGLGYVLQPSFGYLPGFIVGAWLSGFIAERGGWSFKSGLTASFAGLFAVYLCGMSYCWVLSSYVLNAPVAIGPLVTYGFLLAVPGDAVLCFISAAAAAKLSERSVIVNVRV